MFTKPYPFSLVGECVMNKIKIIIDQVVEYPKEYAFPYEGVKVLIDGRDLIDLLCKFEKPFAEAEGHPDIAGDYSWLGTCYARRELFLGKIDLAYGDNCDKVAILECECRSEGCWPFAVKITVTDNRVIWSDFEQPHRVKGAGRGFWDYSNLGPFEFDLNQYLSEIEKIASRAEEK